MAAFPTMAVPGTGRPGFASFLRICPFPRRVLFPLFSLWVGNWPTGERGTVGDGSGKDDDGGGGDDDDDDCTILGVSQNLYIIHQASTARRYLRQ